MPSRNRLALIAAIVLVPLVGFGVALLLLLPGDDTELSSSDVDSTDATTMSTQTTSTTTTTSTTPPTTAVTPKLGPSSPLPSVPQPGEPVAASDPAALAEQLQGAWVDLSTGAPHTAQIAHRYQVAVRKLSSDESLREPTYARITDAAVEQQVRADVDAGVKLRKLVGKPRTSLPPWQIVEPMAADELKALYVEAEAEFGVGWSYLAAVNLVETRMGRIRGTSEAGAQGPMQFLPATWNQYGEGGDINSYRDSIRAAARYLKRNGAPGDMRNALWNYNHSYDYVDAVTAYALRMATDAAAFTSYYGWQVYYVTTAGDVWLPVGYGT